MTRLASVAIVLIGMSAHSSLADTPTGWISSQNNSAYTLDRFEIDLGVSGYLINDTLDLFDVRNEIVGDNDNLAGDTGDLDRQRIDIEFGLTSFLTLFGSLGQHDLTVEFGEISSATIEGADSKLSTSWNSIGARWLLYEARSDSAPRTAFSLEVERFQSESDDFDVSISEIFLPNLQVFFSDPQTFSVNDLEDDIWSAKLLYTTPLTDSTVATVWGGYGQSEASSGTGSSLSSPPLSTLFEQSFSVDEEYWYLGFSLNWQALPRLPVTVNYEMIRVRDSDFSSIPAAPPSNLPGFLRASTADEDTNHTLSARASWWFTPRVNLSVTGKLYSNQFLGVLPHYNNPLSGSFSDKPYGYVGVELGFNF